jgi:TRAP-type transport system periplasmic protein
MKATVRRTLGIVLALLMAFSITASGAEKVKLRFASVYTEDSNYGRAIEKFKQDVDRASSGNITIDTFHGGVLGSEKDMIQSQKEGSIEIAFSAASGIGLYVTPTLIFETWYAYENIDQIKTAFEALTPELDVEYQKKGFKLVGAFYDGKRNIISKKKITSIGDLKGLKMRAPANPLYTGMVQALGAQAVSMPLNDVYTGLQTGAIMAAEGTVDTVQKQKFYEQAKYMIWDLHSWMPMSITFNLEAWNKLPQDSKDVIQKAMNDACAYQINLFKTETDKQLADMKAAGMEVVELTDRDKWIKAVSDVSLQFAQKEGGLGMKIYNNFKAMQKK